ncbi:MAG: class I SAM-dependent methyltransferase [Candidatus Omnitrophica bacterium]|nr:class I SAM-dependent methyltransferase [Candidatus Omnitrophota bacterium]
MKGRDSGMPHKEMWEGFFDPAQILAVMGLGEDAGDIVEFGCGYGTFTIPAAKVIRGTVHAIDIDAGMIAQTREAAAKAGVKNIHAILRDFLAEGTGLKDESADYVMLFNILHVEDPDVLLGESWRILRSGGKLGIIHWNYDAATPRGPCLEIRPKPEQCIQLAQEAGFSDPVQYDLKASLKV